MKKRILSFFLAVMIMFTVFVPVPDLVSAEETTETKTAFTVEELLQMGFVSSVDYSSNDLQNIYNLSQNSSIEDFDNTIIASLGQPATYYYLYTSSSGGVITEEIKSSTIAYGVVVMPKYYSIGGPDYKYYTNFSGSSSYYPFTSYSSRTVYNTSYDLSNASVMKNVVDGDIIIVFRESNTTGFVERFIFTYAVYNYLGLESPYDIFDTEYFKTVSATNYNSYDLDYYRLENKDNSTVPDVDLNPNINLVPPSGIIVDVDIDSFTEWIIENKRYEDIAECGLNVAQDKIKYLVEWWSKYGTSPVRMLLGLPKLIANINVLDIDISLISSVCNCIDNLYIEYKRYVDMMEGHKVQYDHAYWPGHLQEDDDGNKDYTYVTDTEEDDVYTSLLREILRSISSLPDLIASKFSYIQTYFDSILIDFNRLLNYITLLPDSFADSAYNVFIEPINLIIEALGNVGSSTNIEIEIPETKKDEVDLFFDEWHTNFSDAINNKVPVYSQLSSLFNDDFFEKCGLDVNGDGETFAYYTAPGSVGSGDVQTLALNTSALSDSGEHVAVRSLLEQFDHADTSYLDDASYSGDIPEGWTVTVGGQDIEIFDFRFYAKHRTKIHVIITFILYSTYLLSLLKSIPTLIGNVSDVRNAFDAHSQKEE